MATRGPSILSPIVIDASITISWLLDDEVEPLASTVLNRVITHRAIVPPLWFYEVHNALLVGERRGRLSSEDVVARLHGVGRLPLTNDHDTDFPITPELARAHGLSFYDALYLELALRPNLLLATLDRALARAAAASGLLLTTT